MWACLCIMWAYAYIMWACACIMRACACIIWACACIIWACACIMWACTCWNVHFSYAINSISICLLTGYLATIIIPMFFGFEDVPFRFAACSEDCKNKVDRRFEALQHQSTYGSQAKASHTILEPYHIWALRRLSKLGCYGDNSLRVDPAQLAANPDLDLVDDEAILEKITMAKPMWQYQFLYIFMYIIIYRLVVWELICKYTCIYWQSQCHNISSCIFLCTYI